MSPFYIAFIIGALVLGNGTNLHERQGGVR